MNIHVHILSRARLSHGERESGLIPIVDNQDTWEEQLPSPQTAQISATCEQTPSEPCQPCITSFLSREQTDSVIESTSTSSPVEQHLRVIRSCASDSTLVEQQRGAATAHATSEQQSSDICIIGNCKVS